MGDGNWEDCFIGDFVMPVVLAIYGMIFLCAGFGS